MKHLEITCPSCGLRYRLQMPESEAICECSACQHEFLLDAQGHIRELDSAPTPSPPEQTDPPFEDANAALTQEEERPHTPSSTEEEQEEQDPPLPVEEGPVSTPVFEEPKRRQHRIWPWLSALILLLAIAGLWYQKEAWIHHPMVRTLLLKSGLSKMASDSDWLLDNNSIRMHWEEVPGTRDMVLIIEGEIDNRLRVPLPLPRFEARFADALDHPYALYSVRQEHLPEAIASGGQMDAAWLDDRPVAAGESRHFILVLHGLSSRGALRVSLRALPGT